MSDLNLYFKDYIKDNFMKKLEQRKKDKKGKVIKNNYAIFASQSAAYLQSARVNELKKRPSNPNVRMLHTIERPSLGKMRTSIIGNIMIPGEKAPKEQTNFRPQPDQIEAEPERISESESTTEDELFMQTGALMDLKTIKATLPKRVQFRGGKNNFSRKGRKTANKTHRDWMQYIKGKKRINDDINDMHNNGIQSSSQFFKAPNGPIKTNIIRNRKPRTMSQSSSRLFKPFTPQLGKIRQIMSIAKSRSPFYQLPTQNEIK